MKSSLKKKIRKAVFNGELSDIRSLLLNTSQIVLVFRIKGRGTMTASQLSLMTKGMSIQNASSKLNRLYTAGYLSRTETSADSGGIEYVYEVVDIL